MGAAAAALAIAVSLHGLIHPNNPNFAVAVRDDREIPRSPDDPPMNPQSSPARKGIDPRLLPGLEGQIEALKSENATLKDQLRSAGDRLAHEQARADKMVAEFSALNAGFAVAVLNDHEILNDRGTVIAAGAILADEKRPEPAHKFVEIDVRKGLLVSLFDSADQTEKRGEANTVLARLALALDVGDKASFIFDAAIKPLLVGDMQETVPLRIYDLTAPVNTVLASALHIEGPRKRFFVSM
jgi:hypothetical protein